VLESLAKGGPDTELIQEAKGEPGTIGEALICQLLVVSGQLSVVAGG